MRREEFVVLTTGFLVLLVALAKLLVGYLYHVPALIADGYHGLADAVIDIGGFIILRASRSESVSGARLRYLFSFLIAEFLIVTGLIIALERFEEIPIRSPIPFATTILAATIIFSLSYRRHIVAKQTASEILEAEAMHGYSDVVSTLGAMLGSLYAYFGLYLNVIGVAIVVAVMIVTGLIIGKEGIEILVEYIPKDIRAIIEKNLPEGTRLIGMHLEAEPPKKILYIVVEGKIHPAEALIAENKIRELIGSLGYEPRIVYSIRRGLKAYALDEKGELSDFGKAHKFLLVYEDGTKTEIVNPYREDSKHRGVKAMHMLVELGVTEVHARNFGEAVREVYEGTIKMITDRLF